MREKLAGLLSVKTIITFVIIAVFAILALRGSITSEVAMPIITMVVAFYFGTQVEKKNNQT